MDDVIAETGMSPSSVYRYVSGKDELIATAIEESINAVVGLMEQLLATDPLPSPAETLRHLLEASDTNSGLSRRLAISAWAEALRDPTAADLYVEFQRQGRHQLTTLAQRWREGGHLPADMDPSSYAYLLSTLLPGLVLSRELVGKTDFNKLIGGLSL
jgi:AcrR family transcriptional regulator